MKNKCFEELGFKQLVLSSHYIVYTKETQTVIFDLQNKRVEFGANILNIDEMRAINYKLQELNWL